MKNMSILTEIIKIDPVGIDKKCIEKAAEYIKCGKLCAFPTETVYGLGAGIYCEEALANIFKAKGRPQDNPLIVHISQWSELEPLVKHIPESAKKLADAYWGGPLTMIFEKSDKVSDIISAGLSTVAIRLPSHPIACALIKESGCPIAAPSANLSGKPSPTSPEHVIEDLSGRCDAIIDGGACLYGVESTVLDLTSEVPTVLRPGAVCAEQISEILGEVSFSESSDAPKSPGMKYKHYAPDAPLCIVEGDDFVNIINSLTDDKTGVLVYRAEPAAFKSDKVLFAGNNIYEYAANLFYNLRMFNSMDVDKIYAVAPEKDGMGQAVWNRILKSAGGNVICR